MIWKVKTLMEYKMIKFDHHGDQRGDLIALEVQKEIPFEIKRVYYIFNTRENVRRGYHSHKKLMQVLICIHGSCKILLDDGKQKRSISLESCDKGIFIYGPLWREMYDFSDDAVLLCIASETYAEEDYIRNYDSFTTYIDKQNI